MTWTEHVSGCGFFCPFCWSSSCVLGKTRVLETDGLEIKSCIFTLLALWLWVFSFFSIKRMGFLICKAEIFLLVLLLKASWIPFFFWVSSPATLGKQLSTLLLISKTIDLPVFTYPPPTKYSYTVQICFSHCFLMTFSRDGPLVSIENGFSF